MNRRTLDVLLPILYATLVVAVAMLSSGAAVGVVAAVGAMLLGAYYAAIRRNIPQ